MIRLPYGKQCLSLELDAPLLTSRLDDFDPGMDGRAIVEEALRNPIGSPRLRDLALGKRRCTVIVSDHTRPVPSRDILPPLLDELRAGNPAIEITLLVATGFHRGSTADELRAKLGDAIFERERIVVHDCRDASANVSIGVLPSGAPLVVDRLAAETDLLVAEGFIEPHFFAGYSGGPKSVLPGVCDRVTVLGNHCSAFIDSPNARTGIREGNPLQIDMIDAARQAKLAFIVNVAIDAEKKTIAAFAGDCEQAHRAGCAFVAQHCAVDARPADIVIATNGGAPLDQNIYQSVKGMTAAEATAKPGAVIVMVAECADGTGSEDFYRALADCDSPRTLYDAIMATPQPDTAPDQWEAQVLARILMRHVVIFVTRSGLRDTIADMKMRFAADIGGALDVARAIQGENASVTVIPNGISVVVRPQREDRAKEDH